MTQYDVTARSEGVTRTERIDTQTNELFRGAKNAAQVRRIYHNFWNIKGAPKLTVLKVEPVHDQFGLALGSLGSGIGLGKIGLL